MNTHADSVPEVVDPGDQPADGSKPELAWLSSSGDDAGSQEVSFAWLALATVACLQQTEELSPLTENCSDPQHLHAGEEGGGKRATALVHQQRQHP